MKDYGRDFLGSVEGAVPAMTNPKMPSQGVNMTAAASGSSGITVADNDNIDFGTGNFTLVWKGSLPDWTPSVDSYLFDKWASWLGYGVFLDTDGTINQYIGNGVDANITSTSIAIANSLISSTVHEITVVVTRETAAVAGSVLFYVDGTILSTIAITAGVPPTVSSAATLYVQGYAGVRSAGTVYHAYTFNRALTAAEVLDLYRNGISYADKWGSQTELIAAQVDRDFSGANNWANDTINAFDSTGDLTLTATAVNQYCRLSVAYAPMMVGKKYKLSFTVANYVGGWGIRDYTTTQICGTVSASGAQSMEFTAEFPGGLAILSSATDSSGDFDNFSLVEIGATLALEPEGIQPVPGQWLDSSSNKLHALYPIAGASLIRQKDTFEIKGTNTWAGTHEPQSITSPTDDSRAILPPNCYITDIIGVITGATVHDIIIGDGSDDNRWVAITTDLAAGTTAFTVVNRISDGTNYEMVIDPDTNATMVISWIVRGIIL